MTERHREQDRAHRAVHVAIADGVLVRQPCEVCGREPAHGHHDDYSKPLEVRWLCPSHHTRLHPRSACEPGRRETVHVTIEIYADKIDWLAALGRSRSARFSRRHHSVCALKL